MARRYDQGPEGFGQWEIFDEPQNFVFVSEFGIDTQPPQIDKIAAGAMVLLTDKGIEWQMFCDPSALARNAMLDGYGRLISYHKGLAADIHRQNPGYIDSITQQARELPLKYEGLRTIAGFCLKKFTLPIIDVRVSYQPRIAIPRITAAYTPDDPCTKDVFPVILAVANNMPSIEEIDRELNTYALHLNTN